MPEITINAEQRLFVIPCGPGFSCLGFDVVFGQAKQIAELIHMANLMPKEEEIGTIKQYLDLQHLIGLYAKHPSSKMTWFDPGTPDAVKRVINSAISSQARLRIFYGCQETGRSWMDEYDVVGTIGRSTGIMRSPLMITNARSRGGTAILTNCIVRIQDAGGVRYQHPKFFVPEIIIEPCSDYPEYSHRAVVNGKRHARFKTELAANRWKDFMTGARMGK